MTKLRHLLVRYAAKFEEDCSDNILETTNLRSTSRVLIESKRDEEILRKSPHLRTLKCIIKGDEITFLDLSSLAELQSLRIDYKIGFGDEISLSKVSFSPTINKLCLSRSKLPWEKMSMIGELPNLEVLKLEMFAFEGEEWEAEDDHFKKFRFLEMNYLNLKQWNYESSHFPSLEQSVLINCKNVLDIPSDFGYSPTLQVVELMYCSKEACMSATDIEHEQLQYSSQFKLDIVHKKWTKD